jgi:hypothetical protein
MQTLVDDVKEHPKGILAVSMQSREIRVPNPHIGCRIGGSLIMVWANFKDGVTPGIHQHLKCCDDLPAKCA